MSRPTSADTAVGVATYFDGVAATWSRIYGASGSMAERVERFAGALASRGFAMTGADISTGMLEAARQARDAAGVTWMRLAAADRAPLSFEPGAFDAVIASSVVEYVADPRRLIADLSDLGVPADCLPSPCRTCVIPGGR